MAEGRGSILVVEDDSEQASRLGALLGAEGYWVESASDGQQALAKVRMAPPDLVILDAMLPKLGGFMLARLLKFDPTLRKIPILMLTVLNRPADQEKSKEVGIDAFLTKPVQDSDLLDAVKKLLGK